MENALLDEINEVIAEQLGDAYVVACISDPRPPNVGKYSIKEAQVKFYEDDLHKKTKSFQKHNKKFLRGR